MRKGVNNLLDYVIMIDHTNIESIKNQLSTNIYSVKTFDLLYNNDNKWNHNEFNIIECLNDLQSNFVNIVHNDKRISEMDIVVTNIMTDPAFYLNHRHDADILYFGIPLWITTIGIGLISFLGYNAYDYTRHAFINKKYQQVKITVKINTKPLKTKIYIKNNYNNDEFESFSLQSPTLETCCQNTIQ